MFSMIFLWRTYDSTVPENKICIFVRAVNVEIESFYYLHIKRYYYIRKIKL